MNDLSYLLDLDDESFWTWFAAFHVYAYKARFLRIRFAEWLGFSRALNDEAKRRVGQQLMYRALCGQLIVWNEAGIEPDATRALIPQVHREAQAYHLHHVREMARNN